MYTDGDVFILQEKWHTKIILEPSRLDHSNDVQEGAFLVKELLVNITISLLIINWS